MNSQGTLQKETAWFAPALEPPKQNLTSLGSVFGQKVKWRTRSAVALRILFAIVRVHELPGQYSEVQSCSLVTDRVLSEESLHLHCGYSVMNPHSYRSATMGSRRVARAAGT